MKKSKQIQCVYVDCLENQVPTGVPVQFCDAQLGYQQCRFVYGQVFDVVPYSHIVKKWGTAIKNAFHDPVSLVLTVGTMLCPRTPSATKNGICRTLRSSPLLKSALKDWKELQNNVNLLNEFDKAGNPCRRVGIE